MECATALAIAFLWSAHAIALATVTCSAFLDFILFLAPKRATDRGERILIWTGASLDREFTSSMWASCKIFLCSTPVFGFSTIFSVTCAVKAAGYPPEFFKFPLFLYPLTHWLMSFRFKANLFDRFAAASLSNALLLEVETRFPWMLYVWACTLFLQMSPRCPSQQI